MDADLANFIRRLDLIRTALLLLGDHGLHMGLYPYSTANGWVEMSNPLSVLTLAPPRLRLSPNGAGRAGARAARCPRGGGTPRARSACCTHFPAHESSLLEA